LITYSQVFGWTEAEDKESSLKIAIPPLCEDNTRIVVVPNEFPYALPSGCRHFVAWCLSPISREKILEIIDKEWASSDIVTFENPPGFKTIPEITHYHVIVRSEEKSSSPPFRIFPPEFKLESIVSI
jgi:hypothetical protein